MHIEPDIEMGWLVVMGTEQHDGTCLLTVSQVLWDSCRRTERKEEIKTAATGRGQPFCEEALLTLSKAPKVF